MTTLVIIDEQVLFREGLKCLIAAQPGFKIVGEAGDGRQGIKIVERLTPALVVLDLILPAGPQGLDVLRHLRNTTNLLVVSTRTDEPFVTEALRSGAHGYLLKSDSFADLLKALETVLSGRRFISSSLNTRRILKLLEADARASESRKRLTPREHEVLRLSAEGLTSSETAHRLSISARTVEMHRSNLMRKLGLRSTVDLVRYAIRNRVISA